MRRPTLFLLATLPAAMLALPAVAQWYGPAPGASYNRPPPYGYGDPYPRVLPRDEIVDLLEDRGFDDVGRPRLDGDIYTVTATGPGGRRVRVAVDAYRGTILRRVALGTPGWQDDEAPRRRTPRPWDEAPDAPGFRDDPRLSSREDFAPPPAAPRLAPPAPVEAAPLAAPGSRARPADPRLSPDAAAPAPVPSAEPREPRRQAGRPPQSDTPAPSGVFGVNPERGRAGASTSGAPRPPRPAAATTPAAPPPPPVAATPAPPPAGSPVATADAERERRPVRVIEGVTPLNSGGAQSSPPPQNNELSTPAQP